MFSKRGFQRNRGMKSRSFRNKTVRMMLVALLLSSMVLCACSGSLLIIQQRRLDNKSNQDMVRQAIRALTNVMDQVDRMAAHIAFGNSVQAYLRGSTSSTYDAYTMRKAVVSTLSAYQSMLEGIVISVITESENPIFGNTGLQNATINYAGCRYSMIKAPWYQASTMNTNEWMTFVPDCIQDYLSVNYRQAMHTKIYQIWDIYKFSFLGYLRIDIPSRYITDCFLENYSGISSILLVDSHGKPIYAQGNKALMLDTITGRVISASIPSQNWTLYVLPDTNVLVSHIQTIVLGAFLAFVILALLFVPYTLRFANHLLFPIKELIKSTQEARAGRLKQLVPVQGNDELAELAKSFNEMIIRLDKMIDKLNVEQFLRKDAELKSLIQQVNPHFLYNTLDVIVGLITECRKEDAALACGMLAEMFRYNLNDELTVSVEKEIAQVRRYAALNYYRFSDRYVFSFDVPNGVNKMEIVRFSIQPLVENSVRHGFGSKIENCFIFIAVKKEGKKLHIQVKDSGDGIEKNKVEALNMYFQEESVAVIADSKENRHIGLKNLYARFKYAYGNELTMRITSALEQGTCVDIYIPCREWKQK